jgi:hypothetical protein
MNVKGKITIVAALLTTSALGTTNPDRSVAIRVRVAEVKVSGVDVGAGVLSSMGRVWSGVGVCGVGVVRHGRTCGGGR